MLGNVVATKMLRGWTPDIVSTIALGDSTTSKPATGGTSSTPATGGTSSMAALARDTMDKFGVHKFGGHPSSSSSSSQPSAAFAR